ncbi:MAG: helix-turn-helix domain-containing protein [Halothiobacillaceae bacterium]
MNAISLPTSRLLTTEEAANYLNISQEFLKRMRYAPSNGVVGPVYVKFGSQPRYDIRDLDRWLDYYRTKEGRTSSKEGVHKIHG